MSKADAEKAKPCAAGIKPSPNNVPFGSPVDKKQPAAIVWTASPTHVALEKKIRDMEAKETYYRHLAQRYRTHLFALQKIEHDKEIANKGAVIDALLFDKSKVEPVMTCGISALDVTTNVQPPIYDTAWTFGWRPFVVKPTDPTRVRLLPPSHHVSVGKHWAQSEQTYPVGPRFAQLLRLQGHPSVKWVTVDPQQFFNRTFERQA